MVDADKKIVSVSPRLAKFIGSKASREKKLQAAAMQAEFTLRDTLIVLCYLARDEDAEIASHARRNLIPAARNWFIRADRPDLPEPIHEIVTKVINRVGLKDKAESLSPEDEMVRGNVGLLGLGEMIQAIDHNNRTVWITLERHDERAVVYTRNGKVVGAVLGERDGLEALYAAFSWVNASFSYVHSEKPGEFKNEITANTLTLVMDALERSSAEEAFDNIQSWTWRVRGHLKIMNVFEIAEIFEMNSKQAVCSLKRDGEEGRLYFKDSRIANASLGDMTGMDAACYLLAWPTARFEISRGGEDVPEVIHASMQNLIIEAMRLLDEGVTASEDIATELALIDELFEGRDVVMLPILEKVRLVFGENEQARDVLETDAHTLVRKAVKVKISKTVHKYLSPATEHSVRLKAAQGKIPVSTTEKLVLLSYLSHDESLEIKEEAKKTLASLDMPTYRKGLGAELHPSVTDFLVREMIRDESLINVAASSETILEETALHILDNWPQDDTIEAILGNRKLLERSPAVIEKLCEMVPDGSDLKTRIDALEEALLQGHTDLKIEGPLSFCGLAGLTRAARQGGRSGTIVLESPSKAGRVFMRRGKVVGAVAGGLQGEAAVKDMLTWGDARFRYVLRTHFQVENLDATAMEEFLATTSAGPFAPDPAVSGMRVISGNLEVLDIFEVLSALEGTPVPLALTVFCEEGTGIIYRDRSRVIHAHVDGKETPEQAMAAMLSWTGSRFMVRHAFGDYPATVARSLHDFFTEAMGLIPDEMKHVTRPGELPECELSEDEYESLYHRIQQMGVSEKVKLALLGNKEARDILVRDSNKMVAVAVVKSPKIQESEIETISKSRNVAEEVLRQVASTKEWTKSYVIKFNLSSNPKTPIALAMKFLPHLREFDLRKLAKSKDVSAVLAQQARRMAEAKSGK